MREFELAPGGAKVLIPPVSTGFILRDEDGKVTLLKNRSDGYIQLLYANNMILHLPEDHHKKMIKQTIKLGLGQMRQEDWATFNDIRENWCKGSLKHCDLLQILHFDKKPDTEETRRNVLEKFFNIVSEIENEEHDQKKEDSLGCRYENWTFPKGQMADKKRFSNTLAATQKRAKEEDEKRQSGEAIEKLDKGIKEKIEKFMSYLGTCRNDKNQISIHGPFLVNALVECFEETMNVPEEFLECFEGNEGREDDKFKSYVEMMATRYVGINCIVPVLRDNSPNNHVMYTRYYISKMSQNNSKVPCKGKEFVSCGRFDTETELKGKLPNFVAEQVKQKLNELGKSEKEKEKEKEKEHDAAEEEEVKQKLNELND